MPKNFLIGIGGTGARVVEAVVHLCASGYGPDELTVFLVDPDAGNGNLTRTKTLISDYQKCRKNLQRIEANKFFITDIKTPPEKFVWEIFPDKNATLSESISYSGMNKDLADFVKVLFSEKEITTKLDEGFRGHPAIGSVVMSEPPADEYPFKILWDNVGDKKANDLRVFLVGSVFGGTGAAGFPTLGSKEIMKYNSKQKVVLKENPETKEPIISRILLGGALILPYFRFKEDTKTEEKMFVTYNDFAIATKAALHYYNEKDLGFDQIYFIGDSLTQHVGDFSVGGGTQENSSHYIEIVAGLASFDFFSQPEIKDVAEKMFFTACRERKEVDWESFPFSRDYGKIAEERKKFKRLLTTMTVFSYSLASYGSKILDAKNNEISQTWYREHFGIKKPEDERFFNLHHGVNKDNIIEMINYGKRFLGWITSIDDDSNLVQLIDKRQIIINRDKDEKEIEIELYDIENEKALIGRVLKEKPKMEGDFTHFITRGLNEVDRMDKTMLASSRLCNLFYSGSINFCKINYNI